MFDEELVFLCFSYYHFYRWFCSIGFLSLGYEYVHGNRQRSRRRSDELEIGLKSWIWWGFSVLLAKFGPENLSMERHFFSNHGTLEEESRQVKLSAASSCSRFFIHGKVEGFWKDSRGTSTDRITLFLREIEGTTQHRQTLRCRYSGGVVAQSGFQYRFPVKSYTLLTTWIPRSGGVFENNDKKG